MPLLETIIGIGIIAGATALGFNKKKDEFNKNNKGNNKYPMTFSHAHYKIMVMRKRT